MKVASPENMLILGRGSGLDMYEIVGWLAR